MLRTKRSPLKSVGDAKNQLESKSENSDEALSSLSTKKVSISSLSQSVNRALPMIEAEDKVCNIHQTKMVIKIKFQSVIYVPHSICLE